MLETEVGGHRTQSDVTYVLAALRVVFLILTCFRALCFRDEEFDEYFEDMFL